MIITIIITTVFALIKCDSIMKQEEECCFNTNKAYRKETRITLSNFDNLNEDFPFINIARE